jgi:hypothetical protein
VLIHHRDTEKKRFVFTTDNTESTEEIEVNHRGTEKIREKQEQK